MGTKFSDEQTADQVEAKDLFLTKTDVASSTITYIGQALAQNQTTAGAKWRIKRQSVSGTETTVEFAGKGKLDQIWDNRAALFAPVPFANIKSLFFDGANNFLDITHDAAIDFNFTSAKVTWVFWVRTSDTTTDINYLQKKAGGTGWDIKIDTSELTVEFRATGAGDRINVSTSAGSTWLSRAHDGNWHMVAITYDGSGNASGLKFYLDGVLEASTSTNSDTLTGDTSNIGNMAQAAETGGGNYFGPGHIDEVAIWDFELTSANITTIYNSGIPLDLQGQAPSIISTCLVAWWRNGDNPSDVFPNIVDLVNMINGTMTNMFAGDIQTVVPS